MAKIQNNTIKVTGMTALLCLSLACFTYVNSVQFPANQPISSNVYTEEIAPDNPEVLPDVEFIKRLVRKAFEVMSNTSF